MNRSLLRLFAFVAALSISFAIIEESPGASPLWSPSHRIGPSVFKVVPESWDGFDSYDGYFWTYHWLRWTPKELDAMQSFQPEGRMGHFEFRGVYEFRRVTSQVESDKEGSPSNEHWDGVWGRKECAQIWFVCVGNIIQNVYVEYVTTLPDPDANGIEEFDPWFSSFNWALITLLPPIPAPPPSWGFDMCEISDKLGGSGGCDEEYEIAYDPYAIAANRYYYAAIKFRVDRSDGHEPTRWIVKHSIEEPIIGSIGYNSYNLCETDYGSWRIDYSLPGGFSELERERLGTCTDYDGDGILDEVDNCMEVYNPDQNKDACTVSPIPPSFDIDNDGKMDSVDNCPQQSNPDQKDTDGDGKGDLCDDDDDGDGVADKQDAFPLDPTEWQDSDHDGTGDNADSDDDDDCYADTVENALGSDPKNPLSQPADFNHNCNPDAYDPPPPPPPVDPDDDGDGVVNSKDAFPNDPTEWSDNDKDEIGDNADTDDDNDNYLDTVEIALGSDPKNPNSTPPDNDHDYNPDAYDTDDDDDGVPDTSDTFPFDKSEWVDTDNDGIGNNADVDDDDDGMPDVWEIANNLNPLVNDANQDADQDGYTNYAEYMNGTNPRDWCSPPQVRLCYEFTGDVGGQCSGATGTHCVALDEWTQPITIDADSRDGGCFQKFRLASECQLDLQICVDYEGDSAGADLGQCGNHGMHCASVNQWTDQIMLDMDGRNGWCTQQFFLLSPDQKFTFDLSYTANTGVDSNGQCKNTGTSKAYSEYGTGTAIIGLDTDNRAGGCVEQWRLRRGTMSVQAF
ncbi:MAG: thrombospondin type 3 repeat-containing protein [bacterium]